MLEIDGPMGHCFSRIQTVSRKGRGEKRKKDTELTRRVNPNSQLFSIFVDCIPLMKPKGESA